MFAYTTWRNAINIEREGLAVLIPDPKVVRGLLTRYATLQIALAERETLERARESEDVSYTLCVLMGTRSVHEAIAVGDALLVAGTGWESVQEPTTVTGCRWRSEAPRPA
ncbi:DUF5133 domain-containing protein [Streptomyces sp. NPDC001982]|uniref:DUF5133 domain-containing protein n=1 Tax=unclassified Streptomyces TaxID=2593676 RepID=UPI00332278E1